MKQLDMIRDQMVASRSVLNQDGMVILPVTNNAIVYDGCCITNNTSSACFLAVLLKQHAKFHEMTKNSKQIPHQVCPIL